LAPPLHAGGKVALVLDACDIRAGFIEPGGDALHGPLHYTVDDSLLERVVEHGPGEQPTLLVARCGREVELADEPICAVVVDASDDATPLAVLVMDVVALVIDHQAAAVTPRDSVVKVADVRR